MLLTWFPKRRVQWDVALLCKNIKRGTKGKIGTNLPLIKKKIAGKKSEKGISVKMLSSPLQKMPSETLCIKHFELKNKLTFKSQIFLDNSTELMFDSFNESLSQETSNCISKSLISIPYAIEGFLATFGALFLAILYLYLRQNTKKEKSQKYIKNVETEENISPKEFLSRKFYIATGFILLGSLFGLEIANFQMLATFTRYINKEISGYNYGQRNY